VDLDPKPVLPESGSYPEQNFKQITTGKYSNCEIKIHTVFVFDLGDNFSRLFHLVLEAILPTSWIRILKNHAPEADFKCAGWVCWAGQFWF
jgi:hypothetical protein